MDFKSDLIEIVKRYFTTIRYLLLKSTGDASDFAARYCEMRIRRIVP